MSKQIVLEIRDNSIKSSRSTVRSSKFQHCLRPQVERQAAWVMSAMLVAGGGCIYFPVVIPNHVIPKARLFLFIGLRILLEKKNVSVGREKI
jgi:hypothetical protein